MILVGGPPDVSLQCAMHWFYLHHSVLFTSMPPVILMGFFLQLRKATH